MIMRLQRAIAVALFAGPAVLGAQPSLTKTEHQLRDAIASAREQQIGYLAGLVNIPSGSLNLAGVRRVGAVLRASLDSLGFETKWVTMPDAIGRAGHLVAEHRGKPGAVRMLLIGHLDTVFEGEGQQFVRVDSIARGAGTNDMKGGDAIMLYALKALQVAGVLKDLNLTLVFTGDEEHPGFPIETSRRDLIDAAKRNDIALGFEGGNRSDATVARRGASAWRVNATGRQAHSGQVFSESVGYGAIYEIARIIDGFRSQLAGEQYLTFNVGTILGGTDVAYDTIGIKGTAASKLNIVSRAAVAHGDLRFISEEQKERARARMREIVERHLPGTSATITFEDEYPAMSPTAGNARILAQYDSSSQALGWGKVDALDPGRRGAGDISFVAPIIDGLDGLGALGNGAHSPSEDTNLNAMMMQTERAALLLHRLGRQSAKAFTRTPTMEND
jgi:glutamate carboxypeptidase